MREKDQRIRSAHLVVELLFDEHTEGVVRHLWSTLADGARNGLSVPSGGRPHLTVTTYERLDLAEFEQPLRTFAATRRAIDVEFASLGLFPGRTPVMFLAPIVTTGLLKLHREFSAADQAVEILPALGDHALPCLSAGPYTEEARRHGKWSCSRLTNRPRERLFDGLKLRLRPAGSRGVASHVRSELATRL